MLTPLIHLLHGSQSHVSDVEIGTNFRNLGKFNISFKGNNPDKECHCSSYYQMQLSSYMCVNKYELAHYTFSTYMHTLISF